MAGTAGVALIVGASRGLGLGLVRELLGRGWRVIATAREAGGSAGLRALQAGAGDRLRLEAVDIDHPDQVAALEERLAGESLDLLFVVAGIGGPPPEVPASAVPAAAFAQLMVTNALSPVQLADALARRVKPAGTIAFMTSGLGSITQNTMGGFDAYRASKAALNMLVRSAALRYGAARTVLMLHPGWVRTDMGGPEAPLDIETSVRGLADVIESRQGSGGQAYLDYTGAALPW